MGNLLLSVLFGAWVLFTSGMACAISSYSSLPGTGSPSSSPNSFYSLTTIYSSPNPASISIASSLGSSPPSSSPLPTLPSSVYSSVQASGPISNSGIFSSLPPSSSPVPTLPSNIYSSAPVSAPISNSGTLTPSSVIRSAPGSSSTTTTTTSSSPLPTPGTYELVFGPTDGCWDSTFLNQIPLTNATNQATALQQCADLCTSCTAPCDRMCFLQYCSS